MLPRIAVGPGQGEFQGTDIQIEALYQNIDRQSGNLDAGTVVESRKPKDHIGQFFDPFLVQHRDFRVHDLPSTPLKLFQAFLPDSLVESWAQYTNAAPAPGPQPRQRASRQNAWTPTRASEIWLWLGILLYMQNHKEYRFEDFWDASAPGHNVSDHPVVQYMTYNRWALLKRRLRLNDPDSIEAGIPHPFNKVNEWSTIQQNASTAFFEPGTSIAVDEGIVPFQGRSTAKVNIKDKPDGEGIKVWQLSQRGYLLRWIWHIPGPDGGPVGVEHRIGPPVPDPTEIQQLNATQAVVASLIKTLPSNIYHVFVDNLFSSPDLFTVLCIMQVGATGTVRPNAGIFKDIVKLKALDRKGQTGWIWGQYQEWPTPNNKVYMDNIATKCLNNSSKGQSDRMEGQQPCVVPFNRIYGL